MTDWQAWHRAYDDPSSSLARRLDVVRRRVAESVEELGHDLRSVLSLCGGDGRDLLPVLAAAELRVAPTVRMVELDPVLADGARRSADELRLDVEVVTGDAGAAGAWAGVAPVDLVLLCGILGNVSDEDVRATIDAAAAITRPGSLVVWTRGGGEPDQRSVVRGWWLEGGFDEVSFDGAPEQFGVGVARRRHDAPVAQLPPRVFTFVR